ncbi:hypothetical protein AVEN_44806-1 [Araneus ventricosus]|uniref:Uncharacterized protein n=1 Tax=Araneus ventricosus TaxID=182803 RepID=A0A4Y2NYN8_ARAVE|nr:hypothetical protein AVEN_44806-1 [Araneus ventricosus]
MTWVQPIYVVWWFDFKKGKNQWKTPPAGTPEGNDCSLAFYFIRGARIFFSESESFLENKKSISSSSINYHKCLLKAKRAALPTTGSYFSYVFRDSQSIRSLTGASAAFWAFNQIFFSQSDTFLENKESVTASSVNYEKCLLKTKRAAFPTTESYFSYVFRSSQGIRSLTGASAAF